MTTELTMLAWSTALLLVLVLIQATTGIMAHGAKTMAGARDDLPPPSKLQARMKRVVDNHREGLTLFAPLVLTVAIADIGNDLTALGAQLFFYSRVVHAGLYIAGTPMVRPVAWFVGFIGLIMLLLAVINAM